MKGVEELENVLMFPVPSPQAASLRFGATEIAIFLCPLSVKWAVRRLAIRV